MAETAASKPGGADCNGPSSGPPVPAATAGAHVGTGAGSGAGAGAVPSAQSAAADSPLAFATGPRGPSKVAKLPPISGDGAGGLPRAALPELEANLRPLMARLAALGPAGASGAGGLGLGPGLGFGLGPSMPPFMPRAASSSTAAPPPASAAAPPAAPGGAPDNTRASVTPAGDAAPAVVIGPGERELASVWPAMRFFQDARVAWAHPVNGTDAQRAAARGTFMAMFPDTGAGAGAGAADGAGGGDADRLWMARCATAKIRCVLGGSVGMHARTSFPLARATLTSALVRRGRVQSRPGV